MTEDKIRSAFEEWLADYFNTHEYNPTLRETYEAAYNQRNAEIEGLRKSWLAYKLDMRPETRNDFLRVCSAVLDDAK